MEPIQLDDACWKILKGLTYAPKTPQMLSRIYGTSIADTWKRIHFMEGLGLIHVVLTFIGKDARVSYFYEAARDAITIIAGAPPIVYFQPGA